MYLSGLNLQIYEVVRDTSTTDQNPFQERSIRYQNSGVFFFKKKFEAIIY